MDRFFDRFGPHVVGLARFVTGIRVVAAFSAGMGRMRWSVFFRWNVIGAMAWATVTGFGGYALGSGWRSLQTSASMEGAIARTVRDRKRLGSGALGSLLGSSFQKSHLVRIALFAGTVGPGCVGFSPQS